jgi:hypothetical protein
MFKRELYGLLIGGLLLGAGAATAASVFPSSVNETGPSTPAANIAAPTGAVLPGNSPVSINETGPSHPHALQAGRARIAANVGATGSTQRASSLRAPWGTLRGSTPPFPYSVNEKGQNL